MRFLPNVKEKLRNQPIEDEENKIDDDWIFQIAGCQLKGMNEEVFPELTTRKRSGVWVDEHVYACEQILFNGEVVGEKFTYGDWDETFDESMELVDKTKQKEIARCLFNRHLDVNF